MAAFRVLSCGASGCLQLATVDQKRTCHRAMLTSAEQSAYAIRIFRRKESVNESFPSILIRTKSQCGVFRALRKEFFADVSGNRPSQGNGVTDDQWADSLGSPRVASEAPRFEALALHRENLPLNHLNIDFRS